MPASYVLGVGLEVPRCRPVMSLASKCLDAGQFGLGVGLEVPRCRQVMSLVSRCLDAGQLWPWRWSRGASMPASYVLGLEVPRCRPVMSLASRCLDAGQFGLGVGLEVPRCRPVMSMALASMPASYVLGLGLDAGQLCPWRWPRGASMRASLALASRCLDAGQFGLGLEVPGCRPVWPWPRGASMPASYVLGLKMPRCRHVLSLDSNLHFDETHYANCCAHRKVAKLHSNRIILGQATTEPAYNSLGTLLSEMLCTGTGQTQIWAGGGQSRSGGLSSLTWTTTHYHCSSFSNESLAIWPHSSEWWTVGHWLSPATCRKFLHFDHRSYSPWDPTLHACPYKQTKPLCHSYHTLTVLDSVIEDFYTTRVYLKSPAIYNRFINQ